MELLDTVKQEAPSQWPQDEDGGSSTESEYFDEEEDEQLPWATVDGDSGAQTAPPEPEFEAPATTHSATPTHAPVVTVLSDSCSRCSCCLMSVPGEREMLCMCCKVMLPLAAFSATQRMSVGVRRCRNCISASTHQINKAVRQEMNRNKQMAKNVVSKLATATSQANGENEALNAVKGAQPQKLSEKKRKRLEIQAVRPGMTKAKIARERKKLKAQELASSVGDTTGDNNDAAEQSTEPNTTEQSGPCKRCAKPLLSVKGSATLLCACCNVKFPAEAFSKSQAAGERIIRRCLACVKGGAAIYEQLKQEPAVGDAIYTKQMAIAKQNKERLKRAQDVHQLVSVKKLPRITRSQAAVLAKKQKPMDEEQQLEFAEKMRQLVYGRKEFFAQLTATDKKKGGVTKEERQELENKNTRLNALEKKLFVQNQKLFSELYAVIK